MKTDPVATRTDPIQTIQLCVHSSGSDCCVGRGCPLFENCIEPTPVEPKPEVSGAH